MFKKKIISLSFTAFTLLSLISCSSSPGSSPPGPEIKEFVGEITGTDELIAFSVKGDTATAYVCGGDKTWKTDTAWFTGELKEGSFSLKSADNRQLTGTLSDKDPALAKTGQGNLTLPGGTKQDWKVNSASKDIEAGLYRYENDDLLMGVIVNNDLKVQGVARKKPKADITETTSQVKLEGNLNRDRCLPVSVNFGDKVQNFIIAPLGSEGKMCSLG